MSDPIKYLTTFINGPASGTSIWLSAVLGVPLKIVKIPLRDLNDDAGLMVGYNMARYKLIGYEGTTPTERRAWYKFKGCE